MFSKKYCIKSVCLIKLIYGLFWMHPHRYILLIRGDNFTKKYRTRITILGLGMMFLVVVMVLRLWQTVTRTNTRRMQDFNMILKKRDTNLNPKKFYFHWQREHIRNVQKRLRFLFQIKNTNATQIRQKQECASNTIVNG